MRHFQLVFGKSRDTLTKNFMLAPQGIIKLSKLLQLICAYEVSRVVAFCMLDPMASMIQKRLFIACSEPKTHWGLPFITLERDIMYLKYSVDT